jgi:chemotaxis protein CheD
VSAVAEIRRPAETSGRSDPGVQSTGGRRFFDSVVDSWIVKVFPGEYYVTGKSDEVLITVLGSCVSACIRDPLIGVGGMNHFMLPQSQSGKWGQDSEPTRFGNFAMEKLINELIKAGASRDRMEIKVFGGGNVTDSTQAIGTQNAEFVLRFLQDEGLRCFAKDLEGNLPRRIHYYPKTGRVVRRLLAGGELNTIAREESDYASRLKSRKISGEIQLFGDDS